MKLPKSVTDAGLVHLKGLVGLESLVLDEATGVTDVGLARLEELPGLKDLSIAKTGVSKEAAAALKKRRPKLSVFHY